MQSANIFQITNNQYKPRPFKNLRNERQSLRNANCPDGNLRIAEQMYIKCPTLLIHSLAVWVKLSPSVNSKIFLQFEHCSLEFSSQIPKWDPESEKSIAWPQSRYCNGLFEEIVDSWKAKGPGKSCKFEDRSDRPKPNGSKWNLTESILFVLYVWGRPSRILTPNRLIAGETVIAVEDCFSGFAGRGDEQQEGHLEHLFDIVPHPPSWVDLGYLDHAAKPPIH